MAATNRPLWAYVSTPEVFHCAADRGVDFRPFQVPYDDTFRVIGTSNKYNQTPWWDTKEKQADPDEGLAGKAAQWVPQPARFILLHEPSALPYKNWGGIFASDIWTAWHFGRGPSTLHSAQDIRQKVVSPILFVDGHAKKHDFTAAVKSPWPAEPTANWIWYKPAP